MCQYWLELLDPEDNLISRLTPEEANYVSEDPTQQRFSVTLTDGECRGCAVCDQLIDVLRRIETY